jgi:hypothetical protein
LFKASESLTSRTNHMREDRKHYADMITKQYF